VSRASINCILFDLGSTLWDRSDEAIWATCENAAAVQTIEVLEDLIPSTKIMKMDFGWIQQLYKAIHVREEAIKHDGADKEPDYGAVTMLALHDLGIESATNDIGVAVFEAMRIRSFGSRTLYPDVMTTLATLQERGYTLGVVTNRDYGGDVFIDDLYKMGLLAFFDPRFIAISVDLGYRKPHADIFWYTLNGLGCSPTTTAMVGDNLLADIWGAQQLGMATVWRPQQHSIMRKQRQLLKVQQSTIPTQSLSLAEREDPKEQSLLSTIDSVSPRELFLIAQQNGMARDQRIAQVREPSFTISNIGELTNIFPTRTA